MKRFISFLICVSMFFLQCFCLTEAADTQNVVSYMYEDNDANTGYNYNWDKAVAYDSEHGGVYKFEPQGEPLESEELFSDEFEDGTYLVSLDFKIDGNMETDSCAEINFEAETYKDKTVLYLYDNGDAYIEVRDYSARRLRSTLVTSDNDWSKWNNYSVIYEKNGKEINVTQFINGEELHDPVLTEGSFRLARIIITNPESENQVNLYIDNIAVRQIGAEEEFAIEKVTPILESDGATIDHFEIKLNQVVATSSVSDVTVIKSDNEDYAQGFSTVGQYIYVDVDNFTSDEEFAATVSGAKSLLNQDLENNIYSTIFEKVPFVPLHNDPDAALDTAWTKEANYDSEHGNVYKFASGANYDGTTWFTEEFADGTYVVSMDFKMSGAMTADTESRILVDSETWQDRTSFFMHANGGAAIAVEDSSGIKRPQTYARYSNDWTIWNNYSIVYEKKGTAVDVTQYLNGSKLRDAVRISDNFRFKRITIVAKGDVNLYIDNIVVYAMTDEEFTFETSPCVNGEVVVDFDKAPNYGTLKTITVKDEEGTKLAVDSYKISGPKLTVKIPDGIDGSNYTVTFNIDFQSSTGLRIKQNGNSGSSEQPQEGTKNNMSIYGAVVYSAGDEQLFEEDATVSWEDNRHGNVLNLISDATKYIGLKEELKAELGKEKMIISFDFKVGDTAYLNNVGVLGEKGGVRVRRNGHLFSNFTLSAHYNEGIGPEGGALIKAVPWPEDGRWVNVCFVTTSSGVELYIDNEYLAKSYSGIGNVKDIFAHFKATNHSQIDNFMIINVDSCMFTANTSSLKPYRNDEGDLELNVAFSAPVKKESVSGISVIDENGNSVEIGDVELAGANLYIPLLNGEIGAEYTVNINGIEGISGLKYTQGPKRVKVGDDSVVVPTFMSCAFESFDGNKTSYSMKMQPLISKTSIILTGLYSEEALSNAITISNDGTSIPFSISVTEDTEMGVTVVDCIFDSVLAPNATYELNISGALVERQSNSLTLGASKSYLFQTEDCDEVVVLSGAEDGVAEKEVKLYKKSGTKQGFMHTATKKSIIPMNIDGVLTDVEKMDEFHVKVTEVGSSYQGEVTLQLPEYEGNVYNLWSWPDLKNICKE